MSNASQSLPICYYPTKVILVDDDQSFLDSIHFKLSRKMTCQFFNLPFEALKFVNTEYQPQNFIDKCISHPEEDSPGQKRIDIDIESIYKHVFDANRFNEISVIVADQVMPKLLGLDLCKQIKPDHINKILLTGKAQEQEVIDAFNNGILNKYIKKNSQSLISSVQNAVEEMQSKYFNDLSDIILQTLTQGLEHSPFTYLQDPVFITFFKSFLEKNNITEYYLLDSYGSFLLIDYSGNPSWLIVKDEALMNQDQHNAEATENPPSQSVIYSLKNREKILFRLSADDWILEANEWESHKLLHPARVISGGAEPYYYAYTNDKETYRIDQEKIVSFRTHMEKQ